MKDSWKITILDVVAVITIPLISVIGSMIIDELKELRKEVTAFSVTFENHEGRISRVEQDVEELNQFHLNIRQNGE